jgi:hypothetical protein
VRSVGDPADDVVARARTLWDQAADPYDAGARRALADDADDLADRIEERLEDTRERLRAAADRLAQALAAAPPDGG